MQVEGYVISLKLMTGILAVSINTKYLQLFQLAYFIVVTSYCYLLIIDAE
jgi:hypothetical protein